MCRPQKYFWEWYKKAGSILLLQLSICANIIIHLNSHRRHSFFPTPATTAPTPAQTNREREGFPPQDGFDKLRWLDHLRMAHVFILTGLCLVLLLVMSCLLLCQGNLCPSCGPDMFGIPLKFLRRTFSRVSSLSHDMRNLTAIMLNQFVSTQWWWFICLFVSDSCDPMDCSPLGSQKEHLYKWLGHIVLSTRELHQPYFK